MKSARGSLKLLKLHVKLQKSKSELKSNLLKRSAVDWMLKSSVRRSLKKRRLLLPRKKLPELQEKTPRRRSARKRSGKRNSVRRPRPNARRPKSWLARSASDSKLKPKLQLRLSKLPPLPLVPALHKRLFNLQASCSRRPASTTVDPLERPQHLFEASAALQVTAALAGTTMAILVLCHPPQWACHLPLLLLD